MDLITIKLNGQEKEISSKTTVQKLLEEMNVKNTMFVVEKNLEILPKEQYISCEILEGDNIEIVGFFGGG